MCVTAPIGIGQQQQPESHPICRTHVNCTDKLKTNVVPSHLDVEEPVAAIPAIHATGADHLGCSRKLQVRSCDGCSVVLAQNCRELGNTSHCDSPEVSVFVLFLANFVFVAVADESVELAFELGASVSVRSMCGGCASCRG